MSGLYICFVVVVVFVLLLLFVFAFLLSSCMPQTLWFNFFENIYRISSQRLWYSPVIFLCFIFCSQTFMDRYSLGNFNMMWHKHDTQTMPLSFSTFWVMKEKSSPNQSLDTLEYYKKGCTCLYFIPREKLDLRQVPLKFDRDLRIFKRHITLPGFELIQWYLF